MHATDLFPILFVGTIFTALVINLGYEYIRTRLQSWNGPESLQYILSIDGRH